MSEPKERRKAIAAIVSRLCTVYSVDVSPDLMRAYVDALDDCEHDALDLAADQLVKESEWMPKPAELRRTAKRILAESSRGQAEPEDWRRDTYQCPICRDTGWVRVWHPEALRTAIEHHEGRTTIERLRRRMYEAVAKCTCQRGQARPGSAITYDPDAMPVVQPGTTASQLEALLAWAATHRIDTTPSDMPNYVPEFEHFD